MALGIEKDIADYIVAEGIGLGLYDDATAANRTVHIGQFPTDGDTNDLTITVFPDGGSGFVLGLWELTTITIQCRAPQYETAMETQRSIFNLLQENGGGSNGVNVDATGFFGSNLVGRITADFQPIGLGRDLDGRDGRFVTSQSFSVQSKPVQFT